MTPSIASVLGVSVWLLLAGCGQRDVSRQAPPPEGPLLAGAGPSAKAPLPEVAASAGPSAQTPPPAPPVVDPGGAIEVKATKADLSRIGSEKCKVCHKVEFESWSASAHAKRTPPLDCESCHGAGSEYKVLSVMKNPQKARAAGLVLPARDFCATCHRSGWSDDMLARAHAHKAAASTN